MNQEFPLIIKILWIPLAPLDGLFESQKWLIYVDILYCISLPIFIFIYRNKVNSLIAKGTSFFDVLSAHGLGPLWGKKSVLDNNAKGNTVEKKIDVRIAIPRCHWIGDDLHIWFPSEKLLTVDDLERKKHVLEEFFNFKIADINSNGQNTFILCRESLPKSYTPDNTEKWYEMMNRGDNGSSLFFGVSSTGEDIIVNTRVDFSFYVGGSTGDGKTVLIKSMVENYFRQLDQQCRIVIFDYKGLDYTDLIELGAEFHELNRQSALEAARDRLELDIIAFNESKAILKKHNIVYYDDARKQGIELPLKKTFYIFDEGAQYLNNKNFITKEEKEVKTQIINFVSTMLATFRVSGCPMIISSQRVTKDEMTIKYENILNQVFANISKEMDSKYRDGLYFDRKLGKGLWTIGNSTIPVNLCRTLYYPEVNPESFKFLDKSHLEKVNFNQINEDHFIDKELTKSSVNNLDDKEPVKKEEPNDNVYHSSSSLDDYIHTVFRSVVLWGIKDPEKTKYRGTHLIVYFETKNKDFHTIYGVVSFDYDLELLVKVEEKSDSGAEYISFSSFRKKFEDTLKSIALTEEK